MAGKKGGAPLNDRAAKFVEEYLVDLNATQAALRAGYSAKTADSQASRMLKNARVQEAISARQSRLSASSQITPEKVIAEIARIAFSDPQDAFDEAGNLLKIRAMPEHIRRALSSIKVKRFLGSENAPPEDTTEIKFWSKDSALEKLCRHLGLFNDKLKLEGGVQLEITEEIVDAPPDKTPDDQAASQAASVPPK